MTAAIVSGPPSVDERGDFLVALLHQCECEHELEGVRHLAGPCQEADRGWWGCVRVSVCSLHSEFAKQSEQGEPWFKHAVFARRLRARLVAEEFGGAAA